MKSENYEKTEAARQAAALKNMFEPKPYSQQWATMFYVCIFFTPFAQFVSAALALGVPAYFGKILFGSWLIGLSVGLVFVVLLELMKRNIAGTAAKFYYMNELSTKLKLSVATFTVASIVMSGFGTPILVKEFAPEPLPPTEAEILGRIDSTRDAQLAFFLEQQKTATTAANKIHSQNNWKGVVIKEARSNVLGLEAQAKAAADSLSTYAARFETERATAWATAQEQHKKSTVERKAEIENVGWIFAGVCLLFEILFLVATFWVYDYKYHQYCEITSPILSKPLSKEAKQSHETASEAPQIGFNQEGKIISGGDKLMIICRKADGKLKAYDASGLSTNISNTSGERKEYFLKMKAKLDSNK
jgi:hypothetical protein